MQHPARRFDAMSNCRRAVVRVRGRPLDGRRAFPAPDRNLRWSVQQIAGVRHRTCVEAAEARGAVGSDPETFEETFDAFYRREYAAMVRLAFLLTGERAVAEDVVQDAFLRLHARWTSVLRPSPYLHVAVVNGCRAHHRARQRHGRRMSELVSLTVAPETVTLLDAVARLPYRQQAALVLRFYEDRDDHEIAELLGCRPATVRSLVYRGLRSLREVIEP